MGVSLMVLLSQLLTCFPAYLLANELTFPRTVTNVVPSSMTLALHVLRDTSLLSEIRQCVADTVEPSSRSKIDWKKLEKKPLLLSMYAETLRFGVQIHIPRSAPHRELGIGDMIIPRKKLILVSTWLAHTDEAVWNTKEDTFPLDKFWAERFLVDPKDPSSGPTKGKSGTCHKVSEGATGVYFSTEGLEGAWIPYGGRVFFHLQHANFTDEG